MGLLVVSLVALYSPRNPQNPHPSPLAHLAPRHASPSNSTPFSDPSPPLTPFHFSRISTARSFRTTAREVSSAVFLPSFRPHRTHSSVPGHPHNSDRRPPARPSIDRPFSLHSPSPRYTAMASPSPTPPSLSPTPHPTHLHPPPQPQSKRDKRRNALSDKLNLLTKSFHNPTNPRVREQHYRAQIASLQVDMQLIQRADISGRDMRLMDDSCEAIQREVDEVLATMGVRGSDVNSEGIQGRWYSDFLRDVNDSMEERDTQLSLLFVCNPPPLRCYRRRHLIFLCFTLLMQPSNKSELASYESRIARRATYSVAYPCTRRTPISRCDHHPASLATT